LKRDTLLPPDAKEWSAKISMEYKKSHKENRHREGKRKALKKGKLVKISLRNTLVKTTLMGI